MEALYIALSEVTPDYHAIWRFESLHSDSGYDIFGLSLLKMVEGWLKRHSCYKDSAIYQGLRKANSLDKADDLITFTDISFILLEAAHLFQLQINLSSPTTHLQFQITPQYNDDLSRETTPIYLLCALYKCYPLVRTDEVHITLDS